MLPPSGPPPSHSVRSSVSSSTGRVGAGQDDPREEAVPSQSSALGRAGFFGPDEAGPATTWTPVLRCSAGVFAGRYMRFSLVVSQQPIHGRRKTEKDRRPIAHSPILRFRALDCRSNPDGSAWIEDEVDINTIEPSNLICAAELREPDNAAAPPFAASGYPHDVPPDPTYWPSGASGPSSQPYQPQSSQRPQTSDVRQAFPDQYTDPSQTFAGPSSWPTGDLARPAPPIQPVPQYPYPYPQHEPQPPPDPSSAPPYPMHAGPSYPHPHSQQQQQDPYQAPPMQQDATSMSRSRRGSPSRETREGDRPPKRSKPETSARNLFGSLHVSGTRVVAPEGVLGMWFLFTDLTVRQEGNYRLRFRCYDVSALDTTRDVGGAPNPPLCECQSLVFRVYSPRNFPGLPRSTELAEHFARQGFKLNTRKNERTIPSAAGASGSPGRASLSDSLSPKAEPERPGPSPVASRTPSGSTLPTIEGSASAASANTLASVGSVVASSVSASGGRGEGRGSPIGRRARRDGHDGGNP